MLIKPDCVSCILKMSITAIRKLPLDEDEIRELFKEVLEIPSLRGLQWDTTSAHVIEEVWRKIVKKMGAVDPFYSEKADQNKKIMDLYPFLEKMRDEADDPLYLAVKLAILGNSLDFMVADTSLTVERAITDRVKAPLPNDVYLQFKRQLQTSNHLIYFGDNAGEIVFDKLLIETIKSIYSPEIVFVVRSTPTLNDATLTEATSVGLDKIVRVIENGIDGPLPGTLTNRCSTEVMDLIHQADLIISKGGGNFDTLDEEKDHLKKNITFLLLSKCVPYHMHFGVEIYQPVMSNFFQKPS